MPKNILFDIFHVIYFEINNLFYREKIKRLNFRRRLVSSNETSLIGYDKLKCIFVHIPKTAGISITNGLFQNMGGSHRTIKNYLLYFNNKDFNKYYKFCFVRNPWDRLVSSYVFLKNGGMHEGDAKWAKKHLSNCKDFEDFVTNFLHKKAIQNYIHFKPQFEFISFMNKILIDKIYKFEDIQSSINHLNKILNTEVTLKHQNKSQKAEGYKEYYNEKTMKIVANFYRKDIISFNYKF